MIIMIITLIMILIILFCCVEPRPTKSANNVLDLLGGKVALHKVKLRKGFFG